MRRFSIIALALGATPSLAAPNAPATFKHEISELAALDEAGIGFSASMTGSQFLPDPGSDEQGMLVLGQRPPARSAALTKLVAAGADAVPALLACLDDTTPTKLPAMRAMEWMETSDEYDYNRRTTPAPVGVNRQGDPLNPVDHVVTVGELCFVALGQIVDRSFAAVRYQPTGGLIVSSPTSPPLRAAIRAEWAGLTRDTLRASLVRDFTEPDYPERKLGAMQRLAFYFPETLAPLWNAELATPTYDVFAISTFVRGLYGLDKATRARDFAAFVKQHGAAASDGIEQALFEDLSGQEAYEQHRVSPATSGSNYRARECLIELYLLPRAVTSTDKPYPAFTAQTDRERLVAAHARLVH